MKLLLVEDEAFARDGLCRQVAWQEVGVTTVLTAEDGRAGYETALSERPDILLTDVRMPRMRGDQMAFAIREALPDISIIFISGFSDKEYLKSAIKLSAVDYIEKPIDLEELTAAVQSAVGHQQALRQEGRGVPDAMDLSAVRHQAALVLTDAANSEKKVRALLQATSLKGFPGGQWSTLLIRLIAQDTGQVAHDAAALDTVSRLLENPLGIQAEAFAGQLDASTIVAQLHCAGAGDEESAASLLQLTYWLRDLLRDSFSFILVMGTPVHTPMQLPASFQSAWAALPRCFFQNAQTVLVAGEAWPREALATLQPYGNALQQALHQRDREKVEDVIHRLGVDVRAHQGTPEGRIRRAYLEMIGHVQRAQPDAGDWDGDALLRLPCLFQLEAVLRRQLEAVFAHWEGSGARPQLALRLYDYIDNNYASGQLSLHLLAARFGISESHLCVLFRKSFGTTINQRITELRMEKAKKLLLDTDGLVKEIAEAVGYPDSNSFIKMFKRQTGLTPQEFRGA